VALDENNNLPVSVMGSAFPTLMDGLSRYLLEIKKFPILGPEEEYILAKRWQEHHDPKAAEKLVSSHLRLVAKIASGYRGYGLPLGDLIAEGNIGLMQALGKFDPEKGFRFSTYAMWWVRANIQEYILHTWSLVKIGTTAAQKKLFFNLRRLRNEIQSVDENTLSIETIKDIASELNVPEYEVVEMSKRLSSPDQSLNAPLKEEGLEEWQDWLVDEDSNHEESILERNEAQEKNRLLETALNSLNERERQIIVERRLKEPPATLEVLSETLGISRERVRQIEIRAFEKLQKAVKSAALQRRLFEA
jgi:RNA polymerase sigma-32 factor